MILRAAAHPRMKLVQKKKKWIKYVYLYNIHENEYAVRRLRADRVFVFLGKHNSE